jgi:hypothetical protein
MALCLRSIPTTFMPASAGHSWVGVRAAVILATNDQPRGL